MRFNPDDMVWRWSSYQKWLRQDFDTLQSGTCRLTIRKTLRDDAFEHALLGDASALRERYHAVAVRSGVSSRVCRFTVVLNGIPREVYHKQYLPRSRLEYLKDIVRGSRAERALRGAVLLTTHGMGTAETVAMGRTRRSCFRRESFLVTLGIADATLFRQLVPDEAEGFMKLPPREKRELIGALGRMVGKLHRAGIVHGDLRPGNVLVKKEDGQWRFFLLDNERTRGLGRVPDRLRLKNLVQINMIRKSLLSTSDRVRFFHAYLEENPGLAGVRKEWMRRIAGQTAWRLKRMDDAAAESGSEERGNREIQGKEAGQ